MNYEYYVILMLGLSYVDFNNAQSHSAEYSSADTKVASLMEMRPVRSGSVATKPDSVGELAGSIVRKTSTLYTLYRSSK